jgi:hypothetical protein
MSQERKREEESLDKKREDIKRLPQEKVSHEQHPQNIQITSSFDGMGVLFKYLNLI